MTPIETIRYALKFVHVEPAHDNALDALAALEAAIAIDPTRQSVAGDAVEIGRMAYHDWCREHDKRDPWPYTRAIEACIAAVDRARSDTPGVAALAGGADTADRISDSYLIRNDTTNEWFLAPMRGLTKDPREAYCYTRAEADVMVSKLAEKNEIFHESEVVFPSSVPPPFPPWSAETSLALMHLLRREWARCMNEGRTIDADVTMKVMGATGHPIFPETPDAG